MATSAELAIILTAQDQASKVLAGVGSEVGNLGKQAESSFTQATKAAQTLAPALAIGAGALTAALGSSVAAAAEFEKTMSGVKAVLSPDEVTQFGGALSNLALKLGKDTVFSAKEAAQGIEELVKGGVSATDILNGAADATLNLATAGGTSLPDAASIAANALAEFNLKGSDMAHVADLIAGAANASTLEVGDFKFAMQSAGAVAATIGFNFDDLAQAIAIMGKAGIAGSDAGTSLKTMMLQLQPSTKAATAEMERLGIVGINAKGVMAALLPQIDGNAEAQKKWAKAQQDGTATAENLFKIVQSLGGHLADIDFNKFAQETGNMGNAFFDAQGKVKSMADVAGILQDALAGMSEEQKLASLNVIFGSDAIRAASILSKEGAQGFNDMAAAMGKVAAADVAKTRLDNLSGSIEQLKGSLETAQIAIGEQLTPAIRGVVDAITALLNQFLALSPETQKFVTYAAVAATAVLALGAAFTGLLAILPAVIAGFEAASAIVAVVAGVLSGPLLLAIGAVVAAVALLVAAWTEDWGGIQEKTAAVWAFIEPIFTDIYNQLALFWERVAPELSKAWDAIVADVQNAMAAIWGVIGPTVEQIAQFWSDHWQTFAGVAQFALDAVKTLISVAFDLITGVIVAALRLIQGDWEGAWDALTAHFANAMANLGNLSQRAFDELVAVLRDVAPAVLQAAREAGGNITDGLINGIKGGIKGVKDAATNVAAMALKAAKDRLDEGSPSRAFEEVGRWADDGLVRGLRQGMPLVQDAAEDVANVVADAADVVTTNWGRASDDLKQAQLDMSDSLTAVSDAHEEMRDKSSEAIIQMILTYQQWNEQQDALAKKAQDATAAIGDQTTAVLAQTDAFSALAAKMAAAQAATFQPAKPASTTGVAGTSPEPSSSFKTAITNLVPNVSDPNSSGFIGFAAINSDPNLSGLPRNPDGSIKTPPSGFRASGGPVWPGQTYMVGERGPELFRPNAPGSIVPNHQLGANLQGGSAGGGAVIMLDGVAVGRMLTPYNTTSQDRFARIRVP